MIAICGPTASGKSDLSDDIADFLSQRTGARVPNIVVDSMQVYKEIPIISNQPRRRSAELVGVASVAEEWNVAKHREASDSIIEDCDSDMCVLDAGTGMYLNAILTDMHLAPKVEARHRQVAEDIVTVTSAVENPRRDIREMELELSGASPRRSVWDADLRFVTDLIYIRPAKEKLARSIERRTRNITERAEPEIQCLRDMMSEGISISPQVKGAIGIREMDGYLEDAITLDQAASGITSRTRALAKRQLTWFDKLAKTLGSKPDSKIIEIAEATDFEYRLLGVSP